MTAGTTEGAPEVAEAREALARIPAELRNDALDNSVLQRAAVQALHRELGARAAMAHVKSEVAAAAVTKVAGGDLGGVDDLIAAQIEKDAAARLQSHLTVPELDRDALHLAFTIADQALSESDRAITLPAVSWDAEMAAWRNHSAARPGMPADPPLPTDLCRAASKRAAAVAKETDESLAWHATWRQWTSNPAADSLSLLAAAGGVIEQRKDLVKRVQDVAKLIGQANRARKDAGLNWSPQRAG